MRDFGIIVQIGDILVSEEVFTTFFRCDYGKCRGRCCIEGDAGAPLLESEPEEIERAYGSFSALMSAEGLRRVEETGFFELDRDGELVTPTYATPVEGEAPCAYAVISEGSCRCAIERCFEAGGCAFRKPISCSLYPIRVSNLTGGSKALNIHRWGICREAFALGEQTGTRVYQFLEEPLRRAFGDEFYEALEAAAPQVLGEV